MQEDTFTAEEYRAHLSQHEGHAFESRFGHGWRGPSVIRLLKVEPAAAKWMTSPPPPRLVLHCAGRGLIKKKKKKKKKSAFPKRV